ncbi:MAG: nucleotidyltransferase domain-containing protein [Nitrospinae bacterium]|nr:nucleotidyltransferase domain-containing protein [Nitrospinota bacterium]
MFGTKHSFQEDREKLRHYFSQKEEVELAFLFGSAASGRMLSESDVDVAIWLKDFQNQQEINRLWGELEDLLRKEVDLVLLNRASPTIAWAALRGYPLLIRDHRLYLNLLLEVSREAEDFQDFVIDLWRWRRRIQGGPG